MNSTELEDEIIRNDFFHDFLSFLHILKARPMLLTKTGNLQRKEINYFGSISKTDIYHRDKEGKIMWPISTEIEVPHLLRIRLITRVMYLTYQRKGKLFLSKNGRGYLENLTPRIQFEQMLAWYFERCNWAYMHPYVEAIAIILQKNQYYIWEFFLQKQGTDINFKKFREGIRAYFNLGKSNDYHDNAAWAVECTIIRDLALYGLIEYVSQKQDYGEAITFFCLTSLGIYIFQKMLEQKRNLQ